MAIKGSLQEASLPDVLQLLSMGQKTGCLSVTDRANFGNIYFERGRITYASIVNRVDRLGDLLVKNGLITSDDLGRAIDEQRKRPEVKLGEILIEHDALSREDLESYVRLQIEEAVYLLFTWSQGSFYFEQGQRPEEGALLVSINPENLLLEGARRVDEWSIIEKQVPSLDVVFRIEEDPETAEDFETTDAQRKVIAFLDGQRTVQEVVDDSGLVEFDVAKSIFELARAGLVKAVGTRDKAPVREVSVAKIDEHRNLGIAFYRTGMYEEATREFRRVVELQPANLEARFYLGLVSLRAGNDRDAVRHLKDLIEAGGARAAPLNNLALALERMGRYRDAQMALDAAYQTDPTHPKILLSRAIVRCKRGELADAEAVFREYVEVLGKEAPAESYYVFAPVVALGLGRADEARQLVDEGMQRYPRSAPLLMHAGLVRERAGDLEGAEEVYGKAAHEDAALLAAQKARADMMYRRGAYDEAEEVYGMILEEDAEAGDDVYFKLGNIRYKRHEQREAVKLWRRALELNPENTVVRTNLELVERALGG